MTSVYNLTTESLGRNGHCYVLIYPLLEQHRNGLLREVVRKDKDLRCNSPLTNLSHSIGAVHKHPHVVGEEKVALRHLTNLEKLLARGGGNKEGIYVGQKPPNQGSEMTIKRMDNNFSHRKHK